jgi:hypothetical protein
MAVINSPPYRLGPGQECPGYAEVFIVWRQMPTSDADCRMWAFDSTHILLHQHHPLGLGEIADSQLVEIKPRREF